MPDLERTTRTPREWATGALAGGLAGILFIFFSTADVPQPTDIFSRDVLFLFTAAAGLNGAIGFLPGTVTTPGEELMQRLRAAASAVILVLLVVVYRFIAS